MIERCKERHGPKQCILREHAQSIQHCYLGKEAWLFEGAELKKEPRKEELEIKLREAKELIVALVFSRGELHIDNDGKHTHKLFLHDRYAAMVGSKNVLSVAYDNDRGGNTYEVRR